MMFTGGSVQAVDLVVSPLLVSKITDAGCPRHFPRAINTGLLVVFATQTFTSRRLVGSRVRPTYSPVPKRIEFKIATLTYQSVTLGQPTYLSALLTPYQPHRSLRSVSQNLLTVPRCNSSFGQRSFAYSAPAIWNDLPLAVRQFP